MGLRRVGVAKWDSRVFSSSVFASCLIVVNSYVERHCHNLMVFFINKNKSLHCNGNGDVGF